MANRFYGYDIITFLKTLSNDNTKGINAMITTINTERSLTGDSACPLVVRITEGWTKKQFPEMYIDVESSTIDNEDDYLGGGGDTIGSALGDRYPDSTPENYVCNITIMHKSNQTNLALCMEIYAEAIYRVFHKYCDSNILWILATQGIRGDIMTERNETYKMSGYSFDLKITHN